VTPYPPQLIKVIVILKEGIKQKKKKDTRWLAIGRGMQNKKIFCGSINEYYMDIFWNNLNFW